MFKQLEKLPTIKAAIAIALLAIIPNAFSVGPISGGGGGGGSGDVVGPASSTDNAIVRYDGTTGKLLQNSSITVTDLGYILAPNGDVTAPAYSFANNTDTGLFYSTAGATYIGLSFDNSTKAAFLNTGEFYIGALSGVGKLNIRANGTTTGKAFAVENSSGTPTAYIQDNGRVYSEDTSATGYSALTANYPGSGGSTLTQLIHLGGSYSTYGVLTAATGAVYSTTTLSLVADNASGVIKFSAGGGATEKMRLSAAGGLGVGTTTDPGAGNVIATKFMYSATVFDAAGTGTPEGAVTAGIGSTFRRTDGGAATSFYVKESGAGNTGWVAK